MSFLGTQELLVILVVALVVVGPKRLPDLARNLGKGLRKFKNGLAKVRSDLDKSGAMDEINQLRDSVKGIADEVSPMLKMPEIDAIPEPAEQKDNDAKPAETPDDNRQTEPAADSGNPHDAAPPPADPLTQMLETDQSKHA